MNCSFKKILITGTLLVNINLDIVAQNSNRQSVLDPLSYGVVLDNPEMKNVEIKHDIQFLSDDKGKLHFDIYSPNGLKINEKRPAIIFLNAIGERSGERKVKSWGIYTSWPTLMAANGYFGISMECDGTRIQQSIQGLFDFLQKNGQSYGIDTDRLGVYAASANVTESAVYLMNEKAYRGIKAGVLYYGRAPSGPFRNDLPILFVISEGDVRPNSYNEIWSEVLKNNAPWTIKMGTRMPHAFDAFSDNDEARIIVKETISFWKNHLDPVPKPSWKPSKGREVYGAIQMDRPKAVSLLKSLAEENPSDESVLSFYANTLSEANQLDEAEGAYKKLLAINPKNKEALVGLAVIAYAKDNRAEADGYISTATKNGVMDRRAYQQLGYSLLVANKNKESAMYYEKALAIAPTGVDYYNLACAYAKDGVTEKAMPALELAVKYGFNSKQQYVSDPDLASLQANDRFKKLVETLK